MRWLIRLLFSLLIAAGTAWPAAVSAVSLDGDWHFVADPGGALDVQKLDSAANVRPTRVPSSWQTQFADLRDYAGVAWYWRSVTIQSPTADQVALLRFGAVDYRADVYVNGQNAGSHEGGYLPFEIDVTSLLHAGENQIAVRVLDPGAKPNDLVGGINEAEIPHGKQNWYVQTSGLWQSVELNYRPRVRLGAVRVSAAIDGHVEISVPVIRVASSEATRASAEVRDPAGKVLWQGVHEVPSGENSAKLGGSIPTPNLWSPANPTLYELRVTLSSGDSAVSHFGFRSLTTHEGKFLLNGKPIYLRGALDQDFYPETAYTPPSLDYLRDEMHKAKALGLNLLRCHIKVPDPRYLDAADEIGLLVWYEVPNWDKLTTESRRRARETLRGMVERDANHPSIVIVSIINEGWGASLKDVADRAWLKAAYLDAKTFVPWLLVDNSACCDNFHLATDIADYHQYAAIPDHASNFDLLVDDQAQRPGWLFSPYGDAAPKGDEPLMLSEFGNWGLPRVPQDKPWWFARDFGKKEITKPDGVEQRFIDYQLASVFPDLNALTDSTEQHEYQALKYQIEALRAHSELQGYVITEFTDVQWEANGLLDMWRHPKVFASDLSRLQQDDVLVMRTEKRNYSTKDSVEAAVYLSHYGAADLTSGQITWRMEGTALAGSLPIASIPAAGAVKVGMVKFAAPAGSAPIRRILKAVLTVGNKTITEDSLDLYFYPPQSPDLPHPVSFYDPPGRLRRLVNEMRARNYMAPTGSESFPVLITSVLDDSVKGKLRAGARVILIAADRMTLAPGIEVIPRARGDLSGSWISNFLWLRKDQAPFTGIGFDTLAGFETQSATPATVIQGIPPRNFNDVLAGMFYGWVNSNVGVLVQAKAGKGKLLICTFSLPTTYNSDPYATYLLDSLVNYVVSDFTPQLELPL